MSESIIRPYDLETLLRVERAKSERLEAQLKASTAEANYLRSELLEVRGLCDESSALVAEVRRMYHPEIPLDYFIYQVREHELERLKKEGTDACS